METEHVARHERCALLRTQLLQRDGRHAVDRLEQARYAQRLRDPADQRRIYIELNDSARQRGHTFYAEHAAHAAHAAVFTTTTPSNKSNFCSNSCHKAANSTNAKHSSSKPNSNADEEPPNARSRRNSSRAMSQRRHHHDHDVEPAGVHRPAHATAAHEVAEKAVTTDYFGGRLRGRRRQVRRLDRRGPRR